MLGTLFLPGADGHAELLCDQHACRLLQCCRPIAACSGFSLTVRVRFDLSLSLSFTDGGHPEVYVASLTSREWYRTAGGGEGLRGALIDTESGDFLMPGSSTKLPTICTPQVLSRPVKPSMYGDGTSGRVFRASQRTKKLWSSHHPQALAGAVAKLVDEAEWTGHVGVGLPGRIQVRHRDTQQSCTLSM